MKCERSCEIRLRLDRRIHAQRLANRETWETVDMRQNGHRSFTWHTIRKAAELCDALGIPRSPPLGGTYALGWRINQAIAQAIEARRAATTKIDAAEDESAVTK